MIGDALSRGQSLAYEHRPEWVGVMQEADEALLSLEEQLQALQTAAQRILEAPKGTSHSQFRFWLMDALGDAYPAIVQSAAGGNPDAAGGNSGRSAPSPASEPKT